MPDPIPLTVKEGTKLPSKLIEIWLAAEIILIVRQVELDRVEPGEFEIDKTRYLEGFWIHEDVRLMRVHVAE